MSVTINDYSDVLAQRYAAERRRVANFLPDNTRIEHVGSSAVGIGGKNIVDILVGAPSREDMRKIRDILTKHGYYEKHDSHEDRIFLASSQDETGEGDFHIHIYPVNEDSFKDFIILRDFLRSHPDKAKEYFDKKHEFVKQAGYDRKTYKAIKSQYVSKLILEAKKLDSK